MSKPQCLSLVILFLSALLLASNCQAYAGDSLVVTLCGASMPRTVGLKDKKCFVVIRNQSKFAINIWGEDCSWGWSNISFEVRAGSKVLPVKRDEINWKRNFPLPVKLLPGDIFVREINLEDRTWAWAKVVDFCQANKNAKITAQLQIENDSTAKAEKVWTGSICAANSCDLN